MVDQNFLIPLQTTVSRSGSCQGVGVHSGQLVTVRVCPGPEDSGIVFVRQDQGPFPIRGQWDNVVDTRFSTTLGNTHGNRIATVEHLMAAFWASGIHNARVEVDGPEIPILDGSSSPWMTFLQNLGSLPQRRFSPVLRVRKTLRVEEGESWIQLTPADTFSIHVTIPLGQNMAPQSFHYTLGDVFVDHVAPARTFSRLEHIETMRSLGLIKGGSLDNAVVIDQGQVLNPEGLRFPNECARHKVLDLIGDLALGAPLIRGHIKADGPGHSLNHRLLRLLMEDQTAWQWETFAVSASTAPLERRAQA
jgi:UDP-3-O-[3-hydroxymyristoyl] N-acetylglucosamine deacetylase